MFKKIQSFFSNLIVRTEDTQKIIEKTIKYNKKIPYINLDENNKYIGWVHDLGLRNNVLNCNLSLDLQNEKDLFLLFVMASAWSRSDSWENAVFLIAYLKSKDDFCIEKWCDEFYVQKEIKYRTQARKDVIALYNGIIPRKKISFRKDVFLSISILAKNWLNIKEKMGKANKENRWDLFIEYLSNIKGLGSYSKTMKIKILLILRELRCQCIYDNIDGKYCCVIDGRVRKSYNKIYGKNLPVNYLKASAIVYDIFADLYDIPLFAYEDINKK